MDGYALAGVGAVGDTFQVVGESAAGRSFGGALHAGQAVRIFTGAPVPTGVASIALQEDVARDGERITLTAPTAPRAHIRPKGQEFALGDVLEPRILRPADLALLAAMNIAQVAVHRRPIVAIMATGDELVAVGGDPNPDQIIASNGYAIAAMAEAAGASARLLPIAPDDRDGLAHVFGLARGADVIVTIGGASVGAHDLVGEVAASLGMERAFWRIAMRPGKPLIRPPPPPAAPSAQQHPRRDHTGGGRRQRAEQAARGHHDQPAQQKRATRQAAGRDLQQRRSQCEGQCEHGDQHRDIGLGHAQVGRHGVDQADHRDRRRAHREIGQGQ